MTDINIMQNIRTGLLQEYVDSMVASVFSILSIDTDAFMISDLEGKLMYASRSCERLLGCSSAELTRMNYSELFLQDEAAETRLIREKVYDFKSRLAVQHHQCIDVSVTIMPIYCRREQIGYYILLVDRTTVASIEKQRNLELSILSEKLSAAGQLAAGIAHEIRNPLTAIKGFLKLIHNENIHSDRYYQIIIGEMNRIEMIINELLMLAKPNTLRKEYLDITELLEQVVKLMEPHALLNTIEIQQHFDFKYPKLFCDGNQIKQVIVNLMKNAIEAMPEGGRLCIEGRNIDAGTIQVKVKDEGHGIPRDILEKVGDPFFTTKENGTGLGVLVSKQIIEKHKGTFYIHTDSKGTCIDIHLPTDFTKKY
ncbi:ATP-binding protein [Marinicrinis lubricantis]|uniref:histidine kinase n=1 Tax=Marinicrinis lubricantis TaxID=2086470 RepID=A0ABW1IR25_9BACL